jgi:hypothetical protein
MMRCMGLVLALATNGRAGAQEIDAIDLEYAIQPSARSKSKSDWRYLLDNRADHNRPYDYLSGGMPDRMIYFAGIDASSWSLGIHGGAQWMPNGLNRDGIILRLFASESIERYTTGRTNSDTTISRAFVLPGYMFRIGRMEVQLLAGPDAEADLFFRNGDPRAWRTKFGIRGIADVWWEPTPDLMLQYALSGTTIDEGYSTRIALGWRVSNSFWIGPEAAMSSDYFSRQTKIGGHLTGVRISDYELTFGAGHVSDNLGRDGLYARFGIMLRPKRGPFFEN